MSFKDDPPAEVDGPPLYEIGTKVRSLKRVTDDGTYPGARRGEVLIEPGEIGYVVNVGTFLARVYVYGVDFFGKGMIVGMRANEIEPIEVPED